VIETGCPWHPQVMSTLRLVPVTLLLALATAPACLVVTPEDGDETVGDGDGDGTGDSLGPGDGDPGDGDGDGDSGTGETGEAMPGDGDGDGDGPGDGDGDPCDSLGFMMAPCDEQGLVCLDGWTCHFYDTEDMWGVSPVGNCSPPCETDADCEYGVGETECIDANIVCGTVGQDDEPRCVLPCETDADCFSSQFCAEGMNICVSHTV
jgi:hypothetical protein